MQLDLEKEETSAKLRGSFQEFTKFFLKYITDRDYLVSNPMGRESHQITICRALTKLTRLEAEFPNLVINVHPGCGKTLHMCMWVAWCYATFPDCNFIYVSFSHTLASKQTSLIKQIMSSKMYEYLFDVHLSRDSRAKDHFSTTSGGTVAAFGAGGSITGQNAGIPGLDRFSGAVIIDDAHKPQEAPSDTVRGGVIRNYTETIRQRPRSANVPIVYIGQRVHEDDLGAFMLSGKDTKKWDSIILESLDSAGNALFPEVYDVAYLRELEEKDPYIFAAHFQQNPLPAGGGIFKPEWIIQMDEYPNITETFITADTAETEKSYNDATVFSFWGTYELETMGRKTGGTGLHWIDCMEIRIEPKDLKDAFLDFWQECSRFKVAPLVAAIEKKSTGITLVSVLEEIRGISIRNIDRHRESYMCSKGARFLGAQRYVASKFISINKDALHKENCLTHISKITANNTHRFDDIADTMVDAIDIALIAKQFDAGNNRMKDEEIKIQTLQNAMSAHINNMSKINKH